MVYLLDPMVATGGTAVAAINMLIDWGLTGSLSMVLYSLSIFNGVTL